MNTFELIVLERLENIESLLQNLQPKPKKVRQSKMVDERSLTDQVYQSNFINIYSPLMITEFLSYWNEGDRWKKEKVFDISKRLERWKRQQEKWDYEKIQKMNLKYVDERPIHREYKEVEENGGFSKIDFNKYK